MCSNFGFLMKIQKLSLLSWNCRGLGNLDKCFVVRNAIKNSRCDVCCLQETKWNAFHLTYFLSVFPSYFDHNYAYICAKSTRGGCVIAWRRNYLLVNSWSTKNTITVVLLQSNSGALFTVTNVYGPSVDDGKVEFLNELKFLSSLTSNPWIVAGDFNVVRWLIDRSNDMRGIILMNLFNDLIRDQGWIDVELKNRQFTWSNKRPAPSFSKIDRVFVSSDWPSHFPIISLEALPMVVSDHVPLKLVFRQQSTRPKAQRLELFWLRYPEIKLVVQQVWGRPSRHLTDFQSKVQSFQSRMNSWQVQKFKHMDPQLEFCNRVIQFFDGIEEKRVLDTREFALRLKVRERAYELALNLELKWQQRARIRWLVNGDRNTRYFHTIASAKHNSSRISVIRHEDVQLTDATQIRGTFHNHMKIGRAHV